MLACRDPIESYRRVDFDARVVGANAGQLVDLCLEQLVGAIDRTLYAQRCGDNRMKSDAMARGIAALSSLLMGVDPTNPLSTSLTQLYQSARHTLIDCAVRFDGAALTAIRTDFAEIRVALSAA